MMDLDEELSLRIKAVFENYDDGESDMGWAQLRSKYPKEPVARFPLSWIMGVAASLLAVFGIWFLGNRNLDKKQVAGGKKQTEQTVKPVPPQNIPKTADEENLASKIITPYNKEHRLEKHLQIPVKGPKEKAGNQSYAIAAKQNQEHQIQKETDESITAITDKKISTSANAENLKTNTDQIIAQAPSNSQKIDTSATGNNQLAMEKTEPNKANEPLNKKKTTEEFLKEQAKLTATKAERKEKKSNNKNSYEVFTGTFLNYYGDNDVAVNAGFGLNANLKVTKGIFLSVGAGVSQNKLTYHDYVPSTSRLQADLSSSTYAVGFTGVQASTVSTNVQLNAQLLSLDLPITLKIYPTKNQNFYFSTGFNSNSYFAQRYNYNYTVITTSSNYLNSRYEHQETEKEKFKGFDFANSAIFAIGINQKLGKTNSLIFEPYFKPAIGNMGEKNLRINSVGINLKFNFNRANER